MEPPWWAYSIMSVFGFVGLIILNLIVNKINAARIEERFEIMMAKAGTNYPDQDKDKNPPRTDKLKAIDSTSSNDFAVSGPSEVNEYKTIDGTKVNVTVMNEESKEISIIGRNVNLESGTTDCRTLDCGKVEGCSVEGNRSTGNVVPGTHGKNMETQNK